MGATLGIGVASKTSWDPSSLWPWAAGALAAATSVSLLVGFVTPIAGALAALGAGLHWLAPSFPCLCETPLATVLVVTIAVAVALLGPGAFSVDAYLFGRREVVILPAPGPSED